jgi:hypothetical protein
MILDCCVQNHKGDRNDFAIASLPTRFRLQFSLKEEEVKRAMVFQARGDRDIERPKSAFRVNARRNGLGGDERQQ